MPLRSPTVRDVVRIGVALLAAGCRPGVEHAAIERVELSADGIVALSPTSSIVEIRDLTVLPRGTIWVMNSAEPLFIEFSPDGRVGREHGRFGGGPDEFGSPSTFVAGNVDGEAWVFDAERHALLEVSGRERDRREIPLPTDGSLPPTHLFGDREILGTGARTARLGEVFVFGLNAPGGEGGMLGFWRSIWTADLVAFDGADRSVQKLVSLAEALGDPTGSFTLVGDFPPFPFWFRLWAVCGEELRVFDRLGNRVLAYSRGGSRLPDTPLPDAPPLRASSEQMARVGFGLGMLEAGGELTDRATSGDSARIIAKLARRIDGSLEQHGSLLPRFVDLQCGADGTSWLRRFDVQRGDLRGGLVWLRIPPEGDPQEVGFPEGFDPLRFDADRVWGVRRDAFDVATVAWIGLPPRRTGTRQR